MKHPLFSSVGALYGVTAPARLVAMYRRAGGPFRYLGLYWTTQDFAAFAPDDSKRYRAMRLLLRAGMFMQLVFGISLVYAGYAYDVTGAGYIGTALIVSYPLLWAQLLFALTLGWQLTRPKKYGKAVLCSIFEAQVVQLRERNDFTLIAVAGSVGKTSTKLAVAQLLATKKRVRYQEGNYNDRLTVPLVLFGASEPGLYNVIAWAKIYLANRKVLQQPYPFDVVVAELGTDGPGQMRNFAYLRPDLSLVTSVAEEHMEYFKTLDAVAAEELTVFEYSTQVLVNSDDVAPKYLDKQSYVDYGMQHEPTYQATLVGKPSVAGQKVSLRLGGKKSQKLSVQSRYYGTQGAKIILAAAAVGHMLEYTTAELKTALAGLQPFAGRMQVLAGVKGATLLDDTYNASPLAVRVALDVVYAMKAPQKIAILGSMNELGDTSQTAHAAVGAYCNPTKLDLVVTIGRNAKAHLAPAAIKAGCTVKSFDDPKKAGNFVKKQLKKNSLVLAKGSQNGVFAEEALKPLLQHASDAQKLVRQSDYWLAVKQSQFGD